VRPSRHLASALAAAALVLPPAAASAQPGGEVGPGLTIRQLDVPVTGEDGGRSARHVTDHVEPGAVVERRLEVENGAEVPLTAHLYAADAVVDEGWELLGGRGTGELASWIVLDPAELTVPAGGRSTAHFRILVPDTATAGERYAAIVAEPAPTGGTAPVPYRADVRIYLSVGGAEEPPTDLLIDELTPGRDDHGAPLVLVGVDNTGGRAVDLVGELELVDDAGGVRAGPFRVEEPTTLAPERFGLVTVVLDPDLPDGEWHAVATLRSGAVERRAEATLVFPAVGVGEPVPAWPSTERGLLVPAAVGLLLLSLLLVLLAGWQRRRRAPAPLTEPVRAVAPPAAPAGTA
jgi:hypothetical protein